MNRMVIPLMVVAAVGLVVSVIGLTAYSSRLRAGGAMGSARTALSQDEALSGLRVPAFSLVDEDGKPVNESILDGRLTILDFTFTHCTFACPMMNASMIQVADDLKTTPVRILSISVDPEHDTPAVLKKHAEELGVDESRWRFLTGDPKVVEGIAHGALMFALQPDESRTIDLPDGTKMKNIMHPTKFLLIGPDRKVLGIYDHNRDQDIRDLEYRVRAGLAEMAKGK